MLRASYINSIRPMSPRDAERSFFACNSYAEFQRLMCLSVYQKVPSPIYGFPEVENVEDTDNKWWMETDPRYQMLKEINLRGLVTLNAQECELFPDTPIPERLVNEGIVQSDCRCSLNFLILKQDFIALQRAAEKNGYILIIRVPGTKPNHQFPESTTKDRNNKVKIWSGIMFQRIRDFDIDLGEGVVLQPGSLVTNGNFFDDLLSLRTLNARFFVELEKMIVSVTMIDRIPNRVAHDPDGGLFTFLVHYLRSHPVATPFCVRSSHDE